MGKFSKVNSSDAYERALALARGSYQRDILAGIEAMSGSTLKGKAGKYRGRYRMSTRNLLGRMRERGVPFREEKGARGMRVLVIG